MPNLLDTNGFPQPGKPVLQNTKEDIKVRRVTLESLNPALGSGYLFHTTNTGALTVTTPVTNIFGDSYVLISPSTGSVGVTLDTTALASVFVPYNGAQSNVDSNYSFISTDPATTGYDSMTPGATTFTTNFPNLASVANCDTSGGFLYDSYGDGFLYDTMLSQQATIDYGTGAIDTTGFSSYVVNQFDYYYTLAFTAISTVSYTGSSFSNGIIATKDSSGAAGYFTDGTNSVYLGDGTYAINATGPSILNGNVGLGIYQLDAGTISIGTAGAERFDYVSGGYLRGYNASNVQNWSIGSAGDAAFTSLTITDGVSNLLSIDALGNTTGASFITTGGASTDFVKGDGTLDSSTYLTSLSLTGYTVATLPAGTVGDIAYVTDALAPVYLTAIVGGGAVVCPVFFDGTNWVAH